MKAKEADRLINFLETTPPVPRSLGAGPGRKSEARFMGRDWVCLK